MVDLVFFFFISLCSGLRETLREENKGVSFTVSNMYTDLTMDEKFTKKGDLPVGESGFSLGTTAFVSNVSSSLE